MYSLKDAWLGARVYGLNKCATTTTRVPFVAVNKKNKTGCKRERIEQTGRYAHLQHRDKQ
jgi:hypothetical protein